MTDSSPFHWSVRVYYEDTDSSGWVYHARYLHFMERSRTEWLRQLGIEQDELAQRDHTLFVVHSLSIDYLKPAVFNDRLTISCAIIQKRRASLSIAHTILAAQERLPERLLCRAQVKIAAMDTRSRKPKALPPFLHDLVRTPL